MRHLQTYAEPTTHYVNTELVQVMTASTKIHMFSQNLIILLKVFLFICGLINDAVSRCNSSVK